MKTLPFQFLLMTLAGWVNRNQQDVIEYLQEENRVLQEHLDSRRLLFTDSQRRRLAIKARKLRRSALVGMDPIVTPDTLLRWYRNLVAREHDGSKLRKTGRPETKQDIEQLIVRMAQDNPRWGYTRIRGVLRNLGHEVGRNTMHYHFERNHQGLGNELIERQAGEAHGRVECRERLGGVLRYYYRRAA